MNGTCSRCLKQFGVPADLIGQHAYCPVCGQRMAVPAEFPADGAVLRLQVTRFAGFWIRFVAAFIDILVISIPMLVAASIAPPLYVMVWVSYKGACLANWQGQTVGKRVCGIKVVGENLRPLTIGQSWGRSFAEILSPAIMCFGYIMAGFTRRKQALHDRLANTVHIYAAK